MDHTVNTPLLEMLMTETTILNELIETAQDDRTLEELRQEWAALVARVNDLTGTAHVMPASIMQIVNSE